MKLLVTGFEPFNGATINPSQLILEQLQAPSGVTLIKEVLPVEFSGSTKRLQELFEAYKPDVVVSLGQAGNRPEISVERVAINLNNVRSSNGKTELADNAGEKPIDRPIKADGEPAYFTTSMRMMRLLYRLGLGSQENKHEQLMMFSRTVSSLQNKSREQRYKLRLEKMENKTMMMLFATGGGIMFFMLLTMFMMMGV